MLTLFSSSSNSYYIKSDAENISDDGILNRDEVQIDCGIEFCISYYQHPLEAWLNNNTAIGDAISWNIDIETNDIQTYFNWSDSLKTELHNLYDELVLGNYPTFPDPIPNENQDPDNDCKTVLSDANALKIYLSFVATSLYHEINNVFNWSILDYNEQSLDVLFDWGEYFYIFSNSESGFVKKFFFRISSTPAPPSYLKTGFIDKFQIVEDNEKASYTNILKFVRDSMRHYTFAYGCYSHWQYSGNAPMSRVIEGTIQLPTGKFDHFAKGCHGTVGFTKWLGFWLNIPVIYDLAGQRHAIAILPTIDSLFITHGDDPYNGSSKKPDIEQHHFLVDKLHFADFFATGDKDLDLSNVGRRTNEIAFDQLPYSYLHTYCHDFRDYGNTKEDNYLANEYAGLIDKFGIEFLDSIYFWERIHLKIKSTATLDYCFSNYNTPIDYIAHAIQWDYLDNAVENSDSSLYKVDLPSDMKGVSSNCLSDGDWTEMVVYNARPETWIGLSNNNPALSIIEMDYAINIKDNKIDCYQAGSWIATVEDEFKTSVKWLKISLENDQVKFLVNGKVKHQLINSNPGEFFNIYFGGEDQESEINNIYTSSDNVQGCCVYNYANDDNPILNNIYKAENVISSQGVIPVNGNVEFKAGQSVNLGLDFESKLGSKFEVNIGPCN